MEQNKEWVENFWSTGYVIRLGKDQYFQKIKDKRIVTAKIWNADLCKTFGIIERDLSGIIAGMEKTDEKCCVRRKQDGN